MGRKHENSRDRALVLGAEALICRALAGAPCRREVLGDAAEIVENCLRRGIVSAVDHPQGFACLVLASTPQADLRLHVWHPDRKPAFLATVHDHVWDLASLILAGSIRNRFFEAPPDPEGSHELHAVTYRDSENSLRATGGGNRLVLGREQHYGPGDAYAFQSGILHDSAAPEGILTATLLVAGRTSLHAAPRVVRPRGSAPLSATRQPLSPARTEALVLAVLAELGQGKSGHAA